MPGGGEIAVTGRNRAEYVELYARYTLTLSIQRQFDAFQRGFISVCMYVCMYVCMDGWMDAHLLHTGSSRCAAEQACRLGT